jgi:hypothetical protein
MRVVFMTLTLMTCTMSAARADCLRDLGPFHEQVAAENQTRPTAQSQAAVRELQKLEHNEQADEIDCVNTLVRARQILEAPAPPTANDRYAGDRHRR